MIFYSSLHLFFLSSMEPQYLIKLEQHAQRTICTHFLFHLLFTSAFAHSSAAFAIHVSFFSHRFNPILSLALAYIYSFLFSHFIPSFLLFIYFYLLIFYFLFYFYPFSIFIFLFLSLIIFFSSLFFRDIF